jgi:nucleoside-diphosphate-sugar epimerase
MSRNRMFLSADKTHAELGYRPRPHTPGVRAALDWFGREAYLD